MSLKRNISGGELDVPLLGRSVADGEVATVPDFQPAHTDEEPLPITWPPDKWEDVADGTTGTLSMTPDNPDGQFSRDGDGAPDGASTEGA